MGKLLISTVKGFEGECKPTWLNPNQIDNRLSGGVTGFFKLVRNTMSGKRRYGEEFHGIIENGKVNSTQGRC